MTFALYDMLGAAAIGFLLGAFVLGRMKRQPEREKPVARLVGLVLEPITYWADLRGPDGRPSLSKIAYFIGLLVALYGLLAFGRQQTGGLDFGYITYVVVVLAYALGKQVFNTLLKFIVARFPGAAKGIQELNNGSVSPSAPHRRARRRATDHTQDGG